MKLCFGTYFGVLSACLTPFGSKQRLCTAIFQTVAPDHQLVETDIVATAGGGKNNLPTDVLEGAANADPVVVSRRFNDNVLKYLEIAKRKEIVLSLQDIVRADEIDDDVVVDMASGFQKSQIVGLKEFVLPQFLAGLFLYTCQTSNKNMQKYVKEVTEEYVHSFANQTAYISFVGSYSSSSVDVAKSIGADSVALALVAEAGGNCLRCGRPIAAFTGGKGVDYGVRVKLAGSEEAVFCVECARELSTISEVEMNRLLEKKRNYHIRSMARNAMSKYSLTKEIRDTLLAVSKMKASPATKLKGKPAKVEKKVTDDALKELILCRVTHRYRGVNNILYQLSGEDKLVMDEHAKIIRRMYEDASKIEGIDQTGIFNELVNEICAQTSSEMREAADIVVSYFVQRCEVFDEAPKQSNPILQVGNSPIPTDTGDRIAAGYNA